GKGAGVEARLDDVRARYIAMYEEAEAVAQASIAAARMRGPAPAVQGSFGLRMARRIPTRYRHRVPLHWRVRIAGALRGRRAAPTPVPKRLTGGPEARAGRRAAAGVRAPGLVPDAGPS